MKTLKTHFSKNGFDYKLIKRNEKVALFRLGPESYPDGYEVCRVYPNTLFSRFYIIFHTNSIPNTLYQIQSTGEPSRGATLREQPEHRFTYRSLVFMNIFK